MAVRVALVPRPPAQEPLPVRERLSGRRSARIAAPIAAVAAAAVAIGVIIATGSPGSGRAASKASKPAGAATVQRRNLVSTDTESGTLSYASAQTVYNRLSGTITQLPTVGQVIKLGGTLYEVDNSPVVLMDGTTPAYRDLGPGVVNGPDVEQLNRNLIKLGVADGEITDDNVWQAGTTAAVERWQASHGATETGTITLGQVVFLPGPQRITAVDSVVGSAGGSSGAGSGSGSSASAVVAPHAEFAGFTTTLPATTTSATTKKPPCPTSSTPPTRTTPQPATTPSTGCKPQKTKGGSISSTEAQLKALEALLKAETAELRKQGGSAAGGAGGSGATAGGGSARGGSSGATGSRAGAGAGAAAGSGSGGGSGSASASGSGSGSGAGPGSGSGSGAGSGSASGAGAEAILQTSSTKLVVTVDLDATKQSEAVVGEPVTVELPNGTTVDGKITAVSPVAQSSSSGSGNGSGSAGSGSGSGGSGGSGSGGSGSSGASATIPVTIALLHRAGAGGLDQAAVSVSFEQQVANNVLSVPVTALLATAGGGYDVQEAAAPHALMPVTVGLFAAGYVQISGPGIYPGLAVTDSQG